VSITIIYSDYVYFLGKFVDSESESESEAANKLATTKDANAAATSIHTKSGKRVTFDSDQPSQTNREEAHFLDAIEQVLRTYCDLNEEEQSKLVYDTTNTSN
jgi:hypothetical protein